jgi:glycosylphosphatidylinositol transamidase
LERISAKLIEIFKSQGLKTATQKYEYTAAGQKFSGENVYAILQAPRGDATEAMALVAPWVNMEGDLNTSGVALALTLGRYFKRWSLWSKDIIFLLTPDAISGPHAFVSAYHSSDAPTANANVSALPLKSGALQGAIVVDNPLNHMFHSIHMQYDGMNGQLPNLDLINTARHNANDQCGMPTSIQGMPLSNQGSYDVKLQTMLKGMVRQGLGHASGAHSAFVPYQISAITVTATGEGREDDMAMGRYIESLFRSINNLMEKFHQSFFFYLLLGPERFVSIGTYLPSAMAIAAALTIMALAGWIASGRMPTEDRETKAPEAVAASAPAPVTPGKKGKAARVQAARLEAAKVEMMFVKSGEDTALIPAVEVEVQERKLLLPVLSVLLIHFLGIVPLWLFNNLYYDVHHSPSYNCPPANITIVHQSHLPHLRYRKCFSAVLLT